MNYMIILLMAFALPISSEFRELYVKFNSQEVIDLPSITPLEQYRISSNFGMRKSPFNKNKFTMHAGIDIPSPEGTPIKATANGYITKAGINGGYGNMIEINHGGTIITRYAHMSKIKANNLFTFINKGDIIGYVGSTGNHLHYEIRIDGEPVNPMPFLKLEEIK